MSKSSGKRKNGDRKSVARTEGRARQSAAARRSIASALPLRRMSYVMADCAVGRMLVAATDRGISALLFGDDDAHLVAKLQKEYPHAEISREPLAREEWMRAISAYFEGLETEVDLPTEVDGTPFQTRVWNALRTIPFGETRSYGEVARQLGQPTATRAVARACGANPVCIVVPCHRVIGADGSLTGFGGGLPRKKALLELERQGAARSRSGEGVSPEPSRRSRRAASGA